MRCVRSMRLTFSSCLSRDWTWLALVATGWTTDADALNDLLAAWGVRPALGELLARG